MATLGASSTLLQVAGVQKCTSLELAQDGSHKIAT